jgi:protein-disulfide isomerase
MALVLVAGCQADNKQLEEKIDKLTAAVDKMQKAVEAGGGRAAAQQPPRRPSADPTKTYAVSVDGAPSEGPADAKITIIKAYEYACPFCEKVRPTIDELKKKYGNDLRVVYKQFVVHPQTATAPSLAACAGAKQGKFTQIEDLLWSKFFGQWLRERATDPDKCWTTAEGCPKLEGLAKEAGMDVAKFKADMKGECVAQIQKEQGELSQFGVSATPAFFINGRFLSGAQPTPNFITIIDEELKKANERVAQGTPAADYYKTWVVEKGLKKLDPVAVPK